MKEQILQLWLKSLSKEETIRNCLDYHISESSVFGSLRDESSLIISECVRSVRVKQCMLSLLKSLKKGKFLR
jgi:hypothetical protein